MTEEWLNHYRKLAQSTVAPYARTGASGGGVSGACSIGGPVVVTTTGGSQSPSQPPRRRMVRGSSPSIQQVRIELSTVLDSFSQPT